MNVFQIVLMLIVVWIAAGTFWIIFSTGIENQKTVSLVLTEDHTLQPAPTTVDSVTVSPGMTLLFTAQLNSSENGIYAVKEHGQLTKLSPPSSTTTYTITLGAIYANSLFVYNSQSTSYSMVSGGTSDGGNANFQNITCDTITGTQLQSAQPNVTKLGVQAQPLDMGSQRIVSVDDPQLVTDAVNKGYMDNFAQGVVWRESVQAATNEVLPGVVTYDNGVDGVGATLTGNTALGTINTFSTWVDGITRLLVKDEVNKLHCGVYVVTNNLNPFVLTRATDFDGDPSNETKIGTGVYVTDSAYSGNRYIIGTLQSALTDPPNVKLGVDDMTFVLFSGPVAVPRQCIVEYVVPLGTGGGDITNGDWRTRPLNTLIDSNNLGITLDSNTITVPPGTYMINYWGLVHDTQRTTARLRDTTNNIDISQQNGYVSSSSQVPLGSTCIVTLNTETDIQLQNQVQTTKLTFGMGVPNQYGLGNMTKITFTRLA